MSSETESEAWLVVEDRHLEESFDSSDAGQCETKDSNIRWSEMVANARESSSKGEDTLSARMSSDADSEVNEEHEGEKQEEEEESNTAEEECTAPNDEITPGSQDVARENNAEMIESANQHFETASAALTGVENSINVDPGEGNSSERKIGQLADGDLVHDNAEGEVFGPDSAEVSEIFREELDEHPTLDHEGDNASGCSDGSSSSSTEISISKVATKIHEERDVNDGNDSDASSSSTSSSSSETSSSSCTKSEVSSCLDEDCLDEDCLDEDCLDEECLDEECLDQEEENSDEDSDTDDEYEPRRNPRRGRMPPMHLLLVTIAVAASYNEFVCRSNESSVVESLFEKRYEFLCKRGEWCKVPHPGRIAFGDFHDFVERDLVGVDEFPCTSSFFGFPYARDVSGLECRIRIRNSTQDENSSENYIRALEQRIEALEKKLSNLGQRQASDPVQESTKAASEEKVSRCDKCNIFREQTGKLLNYYEVLGLHPGDISYKTVVDAYVARVKTAKKTKKGKNRKLLRLLDTAKAVLSNTKTKEMYDSCREKEIQIHESGSTCNAPQSLETGQRRSRTAQAWNVLNRPIILAPVAPNKMNTLKLDSIPRDASEVRATVSCVLGYEITFHQTKLIVWSENSHHNKYSMSIDLTVSPQESFNNVQQTSWLPIFQNRFLLAQFEDPTFRLDGASECKILVDAFA